MKKLFTLCSALILTVFLCVSVYSASEQTVNVQIAPFYTEVQAISVYNGGVEYPLIVYKDVTYLPLTGGVCDRLWLATGFDAEKGFFIASSDFMPYIEDDRTAFGNEAVNYYGTDYEAVIPSYPIYLNGIRIDSSKEEYPFLNFRGITYMPLTYKYAVEELNFDFIWSDKSRELRVYRKDSSGLIERQTDVTSYIDIGSDVENGFLLNKVSSYHTSYTDEFGQINYYPYHWYDTYLFNTSTGRTEHLERTEPFKESKSFIPRKSPLESRPSCDDKLSFKGNTVYFDETVLMTFVPAEGNDSAHIASVYGYEFPYGDKSIIYIWLNIGSSPSPYTSAHGYLFIKSADGIKNVPEYDPLWGLLNIYTDSAGGAYVCTAGYHPLGLSRWTSPHSTVYYLDAKGNFYDLSEKYPDINSIRAIGYADGKLYVKAMYYGTGKDTYTSHTTFSTVNSGYYVIDGENGNSISKLYPYVEGEAFLSAEGVPYLFTNYSKIPRIVNLLTGVITEIE